MGKNVMSGGYSEQEARNLLLIRGIEYLKGIIPHAAPKNANLSEFDDLPQWWLSGIWYEPANYQTWLWTASGYGEICGISLRVDLRMCWQCYHQIKKVMDELSPTIYIVCNVEQHYCELCGKWENDDIPF